MHRAAKFAQAITLFSISKRNAKHCCFIKEDSRLQHAVKLNIMPCFFRLVLLWLSLRFKYIIFEMKTHATTHIFRIPLLRKSPEQPDVCVCATKKSQRIHISEQEI